MTDDLNDRLAELEATVGDKSVFAELWKRSASANKSVDDPEFRQRLNAAVERDGWPPNPWGNK